MTAFSMPRVARRGSRRRSAGRRSFPPGSTEWIAISLAVNTAAIGSDQLNNLIPAASLEEHSYVERVIINMLVSVPALAGHSFFTMGVGLLDTDEAGAPPDVNPFDQPDDWVFWDLVDLFDFGSGIRYVRQRWDLSPHRRIREDKSALVLVVENDAASASTVDYSLTGRVLLRHK